MSKQENFLQNTLELRCQCSRLLFKKLSKTLEVKCPRCKRIHVFTLANLIAFLEAGNFCALQNQPSEAPQFTTPKNTKKLSLNK